MASLVGVMLSIVLCLAIVLGDRTAGTTVVPLPPQIGQTKIPDPLEEGQRLIIVCAVVKGSLPISFSWRKDNAPLNSPNIRIVHSDGYQDQLQIDELSVDHVANYTCSARNAFGSDQMSVSVKLKFAPKWMTPADGDIKSVAGDFMTIDCRVSAFPPARVRVFRGERPSLIGIFF